MIGSAPDIETGAPVVGLFSFIEYYGNTETVSDDARVVFE